MLSEFEYFGGSPLQTQIRRAFVREFTPITALQHGSPVTIVVPGADRLYLDLAKSYIIVKAKITAADGTNVAADIAGPINLPLHSMFSRVEVDLNGKSISDPTNLYPFRAYLETLLTHDKDVQDTQLENAIWKKDTPGQMETINFTDASPNTGLRWRSVYFNQSAEVEMLGRPHCDIFHQGRAIPSNVELRLRFIPSSDTFIVRTLPTRAAAAGVPAHDQVNCRFQITSIRLYVHTYEVTAENALAHERMLQLTNAHLPIRRITMKHLSIAAGQVSALFDNVYLGSLPERLVVTFVTDAAMNGGYQQNPFNFHHFGLSYLSIYVNGERIPNKAFEPNYTTGQYIREYNSLFEGMGIGFSDKTIDIKRADYSRGFTVYIFDLTPDQNAKGSISPPRNGSLRLEAKFSAALAATTNVLLYAEFESYIEIDKFLNIITPF